MSYAYLGQPYSHPAEEVRDLRYKLGADATASLLKAKIWVYSPIVHCHELAKRYDFPTDAAFWAPYNESMLRGAWALFVLCISGWEKSVGLTGERIFAKQLKLPMFQVWMEETRVRVVPYETVSGLDPAIPSLHRA